MSKKSVYQDINSVFIKEGDLLINTDDYWDYLEMHFKNCNRFDEYSGRVGCMFRKECQAYILMKDKKLLNKNKPNVIKDIREKSKCCLGFEINFWRIKNNKGMLWAYEEIPKFRIAYQTDINLLSDYPLHHIADDYSFEIIKEVV